jgi:hypothetical protein
MMCSRYCDCLSCIFLRLILLHFVLQDGSTPLHEAAFIFGYEKHVEVVRLLLDRGADIEAQNKVSEF